MAAIFLHHVVGDLTVGKPVLVEFLETETVALAIRAITDSTVGGIPVWKKRLTQPGDRLTERVESRQQRFLGILHSLDLVAFLAKSESVESREMALRAPVADVVVHDNSLLKEVDPGTRLIDALEMMKQGVTCLLVPKVVAWKGISKRFSILYNGRWLKTMGASYYHATGDSRFCCLSCEDVLRFITGCLGALAPIPLSSISTLGAITRNFSYIDATSPAIEASRKHPSDATAVAVVEMLKDNKHKIIGEISASKLWKCDHLAAAWAMANLSARQFVMGVEDQRSPSCFPDLSMNSLANDSATSNVGCRPRKFSSRRVGFFSGPLSSMTNGINRARCTYRGRSTPLICKSTSSLAAVMAQMLSHRATHVWVTDEEAEDDLVGVVSYTDILFAVTKHPSTVTPTY